MPFPAHRTFFHQSSSCNVCSRDTLFRPMSCAVPPPFHMKVQPLPPGRNLEHQGLFLPSSLQRCAGTGPSTRCRCAGSLNIRGVIDSCGLGLFSNGVKVTHATSGSKAWRCQVIFILLGIGWLAGQIANTIPSLHGALRNEPTISQCSKGAIYLPVPVFALSPCGDSGIKLASCSALEMVVRSQGQRAALKSDALVFRFQGFLVHFKEIRLSHVGQIYAYSHDSYIFFSGIYQLPLIHCLDSFPKDNYIHSKILSWVQNVKGLGSAMCQAICLHL